MKKLLLLFLFVSCTASKEDYEHLISPKFKYGTKVQFNNNFYGNCPGEVIQRDVDGVSDFYYIYLVSAACDSGYYGDFWKKEDELTLITK